MSFKFDSILPRGLNGEERVPQVSFSAIEAGTQFEIQIIEPHNEGRDTYTSVVVVSAYALLLALGAEGHQDYLEFTEHRKRHPLPSKAQ